MTGKLGRQAAAELVGTGFLVTAVIGSGVAATRLSPSQPGLQLLENSIATGTAITALIVALQPVSAAFNPVVTLVERALGAIDSRTAGWLILAQFAGAGAGAVLANLMFGLSAISLAHQHRSGGGLWLGEVVATTGLLLVIFGAGRTGRTDRIGYLVGGYLIAAYWFTSSTSFANPAVTLARSLSDSFAGIAVGSVPMFVLMQLLGGGAGYLLIRLLFPRSTLPVGPAAAEQPAVSPAGAA